MESDDEVQPETSFDSAFAPGPRRSTYTPPVGEPSFDPQPAASEPPVSGTPATPAGPVSELPSWMSLPAPDPSQAVDLGEGPLPRPVRRSLADEEIISLVDGSVTEPGGTLSAIEQLENQLKLREEEAKQFSAWESTMLSQGTQDAAAVVEKARGEFTGVIPIITAHEVAAAPEVQAARVVRAPPEPQAPPESPAPPLPVWVVAAPGASWSPGPDFGEPNTAPPALVEPPPFGASPVAPVAVPLAVPIVPDARVIEAELIEAELVPEAEPAPEAGPDPAVFVFGAAAGAQAAGQEFSFDDLLVGADSQEPANDTAPEAIFIEPMPVAAGESVPTDTGSVRIIDQAYEQELDDDVDEVDRVVAGIVGAVAVNAAGEAAMTGSIPLPSGPISTMKIPADEVVLLDNEPVRQRVFTLEDSGLEPTPTDQRVGRAARLFWLWFAANSSILSLGLGAAVFAVGMSLRQSIVAILAGVALSFIPLGLTTLAGKRSGQPTMVVSRATFGLIGNILPATLALVTRLFWGAVLLWLLASSVSIVLVGAELSGPLGERQLLLIALAVALILALVVAFAGYPLIARVQLVLSVASGILVVGLIVLTAEYLDIATALTTPDGSWLLTVTGAVLVFSFVGLVWANSGADLARYQRAESSGRSSMLWATFGATLPSFALIAWGALLAASNQGIAAGFLSSPLDTLSLMLPLWYPIPLIAATVLSLLSGIVIMLYSGGFALQAMGVRVRRQWSIVIVGIALLALALVFTFGINGGITELFRDVATTIAVPTAAWAGIFAAEMMIRNRRFEAVSLTTRGGVYPDVRWVNFVGLLLISAVGFGLSSATVTWLGWQGYVFALIGVPLNGDLATSDVGVLVALALGLLLPIVAGIPAIRRQEAARV